MRGAKAKALRRLAEKKAAELGLPAQVDHRAKPRSRDIILDGKPLKYKTHQCVLGPCERQMYHRAKAKFADGAPIVGALRLQRRIVAEATKNMEIIPIDPPNQTENT